MANRIPLTIVAGINQALASADLVHADGIAPRSGTTLSLGADATTTVINMNGVAVTTINIGNASTQVNIPGTLTVSTTATMDGDTAIGDNISDSLTVTAGILGNLTFRKEANHLLLVEASTTLNAAGGEIGLQGGAGTGTGNGGDVTLTGGTSVSGIPGSVSVVSTRTVATQGAALTITQDGTPAGIFVGTVDPSAGGGVVATEGSLFLRDAGASGSLWIKTGAAATAWSAVGTGGPDSLQTAYDTGPDILQTAADGGIEITRGTSTDTHVLSLVDAGTAAQPVFTVSKTGASTANIVEITKGLNVTGGSALFVDNGLGTGNAVTFQVGSADVFVITDAGQVSITPPSGQNISGQTTGGGDIFMQATGGGDVTVGSIAVGGPGGNTLLGATNPSGTSGGTALVAGGFTYPLPGSGQIYIDSISGTEIQYQTNLRITVTDDIQNTPASGADYGVVCTGAGGDFSATTETGTITIAGQATSGTGGLMDVFTSATTGTAGDIGFRSRALSSGGTSGTVTVGTTAAAGATANDVTVGSAAVGNGTASNLLLVTQAGTAGTAGDIEVRIQTDGAGTNGDLKLTNTTTGSGGSVGDVLIGSYSANAATVGGISIKAGTSAPAAPAAQNVLIVGRLGVTIEAETSTSDVTFDARGMTTPVTLNESGDLDLDGSFTATSIIGALNELKTAPPGTADQVVQAGFDTTTNSLADGDLGYLTTTANRVQKAIATSIAAAAVFGANEGTAGSMTTHGTIENQNVESTITVTAGDRLYLSASEAGKVTNVAPTTSGQVVLAVGYARTSNGGAGNDVSMLLLIGTPVLL